jgi:hypothetical protein
MAKSERRIMSQPVDRNQLQFSSFTLVNFAMDVNANRTGDLNSVASPKHKCQWLGLNHLCWGRNPASQRFSKPGNHAAVQLDWK